MPATIAVGKQAIIIDLLLRGSGHRKSSLISERRVTVTANSVATCISSVKARSGDIPNIL